MCFSKKILDEYFGGFFCPTCNSISSENILYFIA